MFRKRMGIVCLVLSTISLFAADIPLPAPHRTGGMPLMEALAARQSNRSFSSRPLDKQMLSDLLWAAFGINRADGKRTAPSARNRQEMDIYVALSSGLYLYDAEQNRLVQVLETDIRERVGKQTFTQEAPVGLIYVSETSRMKGSVEFYSAADTGFISQNVYLFCASAGLNTVVLGMVDKDALHQAMQLKPSQQIILTQPVGYRPVPEKTEVSSTVQWRDGTYAGTSKGYKGPVHVSVTVKDGRIADIQITNQNESRARTSFTETPSEIIKQQKADVDAVTGATVTSRAVMNAVADALKQADR